MKRSELEHIIRAAASITNQTEFVVIGSQSILGQFPDAHTDLLVSMEADIFPLNREDLSIEVDGAIGELSPFHLTFGYYAHGIYQNTASLPAGWKSRLVPICNTNTKGATGWCLDVHDLAASKLAAGREKDMKFLDLLLKKGMIQLGILQNRIEEMDLPEPRCIAISERFQKLRRSHGFPPDAAF